MQDFIDARINKVLQELEKDVLVLLRQLWDSIHCESEEVLDRFSLLSGISVERLKGIFSYISASVVICEPEKSSDEVFNKREINLTIQEIHSICNVIRFTPFFNRYLSSHFVMDQIVKKIDSIIERWNERVNYYCDFAKNVLNKLVQRTGVKSAKEFFSIYHIFIDAGTLCEENTKNILDIFISEIMNTPKSLKIIVPKAVIDCLQSMGMDTVQNCILRKDEGLRNLKKMQEAGILEIRGDNADTTILGTFMSAFIQFKPIYKMMIITQDGFLANAIDKINNSNIRCDEILLCKVDESNIIDFWNRNGNTAIMSGEEAMLDDKDQINSDTLKTVSSFQIEKSEMDFSDDDYVDDEIETDIEKMVMLEEQLANMLGRKIKYINDLDDDFDTEEKEFDFQ